MALQDNAYIAQNIHPLWILESRGPRLRLLGLLSF